MIFFPDSNVLNGKVRLLFWNAVSGCWFGNAVFLSASCIAKHLTQHSVKLYCGEQANTLLHFGLKLSCCSSVSAVWAQRWTLLNHLNPASGLNRMLACVVSEPLQEISSLASTGSQVVWGLSFVLYAHTQFKNALRNGQRGDSDPYKNAVWRHGLLRGLSISPELQWLTGESSTSYRAS